MTLNLNTDPYNDDYAESDKFYKILFRPSYPVQARELTQLQTILQTQIKRHGNAIFKQGAMVVPGQMSIFNSIEYIKLDNTYAGANLDSYIKLFAGTTLTGTSGVTANVFYVSPATVVDPHLLYIVYTKAGTTSTVKKFSAGEVVTSNTGYSASISATAATGSGSFASIQSGVYYVNGNFALVEAQTIILDKMSNTPSYRVGLTINEKIVTPEENSKLLDNAQGTYNYAAPGAHRHYIELILDKRTLTSTDDSTFITLSVVDSSVIKRDTRTTAYSAIEDVLARRTFDESGSYTVKNFQIDIREYRNNNRGSWVNATPYIAGDVVTSNGLFFTCISQGVSSVAPTATLIGSLVTDGTLVWEYTPTPVFNRGIFSPLVTETTLANHLANEAMLSIGLEPGKAYVQGYEIEKIATEFISNPKARTTSPTSVANAVISTNIGNYVLTNSASSIPAIFSTLIIYDRYATVSGSIPSGGVVVGTAKFRGTEYHSSGIQKLFLFDIKMNTGYTFDRNAKSFYNATFNFTANASADLTNLVGSVSSSTTTLTGVGTSFITDLKVGDSVFIPGTGQTIQIASIASQTSATLVAAPATITGQSYQLMKASVREPLFADAFFLQPFYATSTIANITYNSYEKLTDATSTAGGVATFNYTGTGSLTSSGSLTNYTFTSGNTIVTPASISVSGSQVTVTGVPVSATISAMAAIQYVGSAGVTEKIKTLNFQSTVFSTSAAANSVIVLDKADGFKLARVEMDTVAAFGGSPTFTNVVDITDRYTFFDGQTESYYGPASIKLKPSYAPPSNPIRVTFQYFAHGSGHFFSKNSYSSIDYRKIPTFGGIELRDVIDFRPRSDDGITVSGTAAVKRGVNITADISYYLNRKDLVAINSTGKFTIINGESSENAKEPIADENTMVLYSLNLQPYTSGTSNTNVIVKLNDNKRYTMRDIGKLENRIGKLEYYTSLSLLEQETNSLSIRDPNGLERYKNGFAVDSFKGNGIGDTTSVDYVASTDPLAGELRPYFAMKNVNLVEQATSDSGRLALNYKMYGDVMTLPLDPTTPNVALITQPYGTRLENVNPFAVFTFLGETSINPSTDDWFEVNRLPDVIQSAEGNYSAITSSLASQGILGTVWNGWQNQWAGTPVVTDISSTVLSSYDIFTHGARGIVTVSQLSNLETSATTVGQTRSGVNTIVVPTYSNTTVGDRVVSSSVIPYIRSRNVLIQARRLKPKTRFYSFFDGVGIDSYCTPATRITYTLTSTKEFDVDTNVGLDQVQTARLINGDSQVCLNKGDVITMSNGATAVVVGNSISSGVRTLDIVNVTGTLTVGNTFSGSIQNAALNVATGTILSVVPQTNLVTNNNGELNFILTIPNSDSIRFRVGERELKLIDSPTDDIAVSSRARGTYFAKGILENKQATILSVRNGEVSSSTVGDSRTIVETSSRTFHSTVETQRPGDPLAQTFFVQNPGGAFLSKVDLFFASKDTNIPVTIEIREVVNGYPSSKSLPFSRVTLKPEKVSISTNTVSLFGTIVPSYDTPTSFVFETPVYVGDGTQYAIVIMAESQAYKVWISQLGDSVPGTQRIVSEQPNLGVLFKSQNASTWTPDQSQDLMFTLWRAKFNIGTLAAPTQGLARFVNDNNPLQIVPTNPFEARVGSAKVRIHQPDHCLNELSSATVTPVYLLGNTTITTTTSSTSFTLAAVITGMTVGASVYTSAGVFIGDVATLTSTSGTFVANAAVALTAAPFQYVNRVIAGILNSDIFKTHTNISSMQADSYVITTTGSATASGYFGGNGVRISSQIRFDTIHPIVQVLNFPETDVTYSIFGTSGKSLNSTQTPYAQDSTAIKIVPNDNNSFLAPKVIANRESEVARLAGDRSFKLDIKMTSTNDSLSPMIDTDRLSLIAIQNRINSPSETNTNVSGLDDQLLLTSTLVAFSSQSIVSADANTQTLLLSVPVGRYITITGATTGSNNATWLVTGYVATGITVTPSSGTVNLVDQVAGASITINQRISFMSEIAAVGSTSLSKYVTKRINLENSSTFLRVRLAAIIPPGAAVEVYYRTSQTGSTTDLTKVPYVLMNADAIPPVTANSFTDLNYSLSGLVPFDGISFKIVLKSLNSSLVPRVKDLRIIACA